MTGRPLSNTTPTARALGGSGNPPAEAHNAPPEGAQRDGKPIGREKLGAVTYDFAPLPTRAVRDARLTNEHFRVLGMVARHDGLGRNGTGCYAGLRTLAKETGLTVEAVEQAIADLEAWQYLYARPNQRNQDRTSLRVMYTDEDRAVMPTRRARSS